ncbi:MAG TPA: ScpA family protein [Candidatus Woesearchaeota archaeon]|nr:ScpA family protein [Candidatus Woesearchaeota archaeon]
MVLNKDLKANQKASDEVVVSQVDANLVATTDTTDTTQTPIDYIYNVLTDKDEIDWKDILMKLIKDDNIDPWDVDVSLIAKRYVEAVKKLKEMDFRVSGKVILASAILLSIKSNRLVDGDINAFDALISSLTQTEYDELLSGELGDFLSGEYIENIPLEEREKLPFLTLRTPQPRSRKISILDLVEALDKALEVRDRRQNKISSKEEKIFVPNKEKNLKSIILSVYESIQSVFQKKDKIFFSEIIKSPNREDVIYTFIPLLHLDFQQVVRLDQDTEFGEIEISLIKKNSEELK